MILDGILKFGVKWHLFSFLLPINFNCSGYINHANNSTNYKRKATTTKFLNRLSKLLIVTNWGPNSGNIPYFFTSCFHSLECLICFWSFFFEDPASIFISSWSFSHWPHFDGFSTPYTTVSYTWKLDIYHISSILRCTF